MWINNSAHFFYHETHHHTVCISFFFDVISQTSLLCNTQFTVSPASGNIAVLDIFQIHVTLRFVRQRRLTLTLFNRGDVSSNWNLSFSSATKYYIFVLRSFFTLPNSACHDEMPHDGISPVYKFKKHVPKYISQLKCSRISFSSYFLFCTFHTCMLSLVVTCE